MVWDIHPAIFTLGWYELRYYSLLFALGFILGFIYFTKVYQWENKPASALDSGLVHVVLGTIIGARLGHVLFYSPHWIWENPLQIVKVWEGGLASHGGLIGLLISCYLYTRKFPQINYLWFLDRLSVPTALCGSFIRLGNFFNSEIIGKATEKPWGIVFSRVDSIKRHPTQLYESFGYLTIFFILLLIYLSKKEKTPRGRLVGLFLILVFSWRFIIEFLKERQNEFDSTLYLDMGQLLSIPAIFGGIVLLIYSFKKKTVQS